MPKAAAKKKTPEEERRSEIRRMKRKVSGQINDMKSVLRDHKLISHLSAVELQMVKDQLAADEDHMVKLKCCC